MAISVVRLGSKRGRLEGLRIGTVRRPPRGIRKTQLASADFYDVWLPELAPSAPLVKRGLAARSDREWTAFVGAYRREMSRPVPRRLLDLLAALSHTTDFAVGCYCANEATCHRSILRELLREHGGKLR